MFRPGEVISLVRQLLVSVRNIVQTMQTAYPSACGMAGLLDGSP